jgi:hypothetical protein
MPFLLVFYLTTHWLFIERDDYGNCVMYAAVNGTYSKKLAESVKWHEQGVQKQAVQRHCKE